MSKNPEIVTRKAAKSALIGSYFVKVIPKNKLNRDNPSQYTKLIKATKAISHIFDGMKVVPNPFLNKYTVVV